MIKWSRRDASATKKNGRLRGRSSVVRRILVEPEVDLDGNQHVDGFPVFHGGLETPLLDCFDGLFIQAETERVRYFDVVSKPIWPDDNGQHARSLVLRFPRLFGIFRFGIENQFRSSDASADTKHTATGPTAAPFAES